MSELLTMEEIEARYDGEWVVLTDVQADPGPKVRGGRVYWHGADHDEAWERAGDIPPPLNIAVYYIGQWVIDEETGPIPVLTPFLLHSVDDLP